MKAITPATRDLRVVATQDEKLEPAEQTTFVARPMTRRERMASYDNMNTTEILPDGTQVRRQRTFAQSIEILVATLKAVENFPAGAEEPYPADGTRDEKLAYLDRVPGDMVLFQIAEAIRDRSEAGETQGN